MRHRKSFERTRVKPTAQFVVGVLVISLTSLPIPFANLSPANVTAAHSAVLLAPQEPNPASPPTIRQVIITREIQPPRPPSLSDAQARNDNARRSHHVDELQDAFPGIDGRDIVAAVFDDGPIRWTHKEFRLVINEPSSSRVKFRLGPAPTDRFARHATHVAGTIGASGNFTQAVKGMAPAIQTIYSEDMYRDLDSLQALAPFIRISNHSYGPPSGWERDPRDGAWIWCGDASVDQAEDAKFGKYMDKEARLDFIIYRSPELLSFIAAGNNREDGPRQQPTPHWLCSGTTLEGTINFTIADNISRKVDGFDHGGLDTVSGLCVSKNAICIGAIGDLPPVSGSVTGAIESYSSWGPTDDGRIKPDLVANGHQLRSTSDADDEATFRDSGTSMAAPTAAGITALLLQLYKRERNENPFAAVMKAVLIHSATDGGAKGPDPIFGWGSIDALKAGRVIAAKDGQTFRHMIMRIAVSKTNPTWKIELEPTGNVEDLIKATIVWTDPPGAANTQGLDDPLPTLQNDLDMRLIAPDGTIYFPYSLDLNDSLALARQSGPNRVDNVEVIENAGALAGRWTLEVKGTTLRSSQQDFAIVISGLKPQ